MSLLALQPLWNGGQPSGVYLGGPIKTRARGEPEGEELDALSRM